LVEKDATRFAVGGKLGKPGSPAAKPIASQQRAKRRDADAGAGPRKKNDDG